MDHYGRYNSSSAVTRHESTSSSRSFNTSRIVAVTCAELFKFIQKGETQRIDRYQIGDQEVFQLKLLAQIQSIENGAHNVKYELDDKTGARIRARYLKDDAEHTNEALAAVQTGMYVHAFGKLHSFANETYIDLLHPLRPISHIDEIAEHVLLVIRDHHNLLGGKGAGDRQNTVVQQQLDTSNGSDSNNFRTPNGSVTGSPVKPTGGFVQEDDALRRGRPDQNLIRATPPRATAVSAVASGAAGVTPSTPVKRALDNGVAGPSTSTLTPKRVLGHDVLQLPASEETSRTLTPDERTIYNYLLRMKDNSPGCSYTELIAVMETEHNLQGASLMRAVTSLMDRKLVDEVHAAAPSSNESPSGSKKYLRIVQ